MPSLRPGEYDSIPARTGEYQFTTHRIPPDLPVDEWIPHLKPMGPLMYVSVHTNSPLPHPPVMVDVISQPHPLDFVVSFLHQ